MQRNKKVYPTINPASTALKKTKQLHRKIRATASNFDFFGQKKDPMPEPKRSYAPAKYEIKKWESTI